MTNAFKKYRDRETGEIRECKFDGDDWQCIQEIPDGGFGCGAREIFFLMPKEFKTWFNKWEDITND